MSRDELRETFFLECEDLMEALVTGLSAMADGSSDDETINVVFRAVHSIKGGAGAFGLDELVGFAHIFETSLDGVRGGQIELGRDLLTTFLRASDMLSDLVVFARDGTTADADAVAQMLGELSALVGEDNHDEEVEADSFQPLGLNLSFDLDDDDGPGEQAYTISFRPNAQFYSRGNEATLLLRALAELGEIEAACCIDGVPALEDLDPNESHLAWTVHLATEADLDDINEIFEFAIDDCDLTIEPAGAGLPDLEPLLPDLNEPLPLDLDDPVPSPEVASEPKPKEQDPAPAAAKQSDGPRPTIRVDLNRVDVLINLVGELVINQAMLSQSVLNAGVPHTSSVKDGLEEFKRLTRNIQESVMAIRAQPVKPLFQRMSRIVREAAQATGKEVRLVTEGADTEVDKTVVESLADPLTHMIRNAVDHGLEAPDVREQNAKDREGTVRLVAAHRSGRVIIEISDDGAGINRERVKQIAIDKELIAPDANLADGEIDNLLFLPGFSTAKEVSNLSGRGVGMDVVRKSIQSLGGRIAISSNPGSGTTLTISLPLTLAVLDGIIVNVGGETLIVPLTSVVETMKPKPDEICRIDQISWALHSRGEFISIVDVGFELGIRDRLVRHEDQVILVINTEDGSRQALIIDDVQDQRQVVIKSLQTNYGDVPGIAAATILGDGRIALILDVDVLVASASGDSKLIDGNLAMVG